MAALLLEENALHKSEMEYHRIFGHTLGRIQPIYFMNRINLRYETCRLATHTMAPTLPGCQGIKRCVQYLANHLHKPIFYPSNYYDVSNVIRLTWNGNQVEDYIIQNCLECHQDAYHAIIINRRRSVSGIIHTLLCAAIYWKLQIQPAIASDSTDGEIRCI